MVWEQAEYSERGDTGTLPYTIILGEDFASVAPADYASSRSHKRSKSMPAKL